MEYAEAQVVAQSVGRTVFQLKKGLHVLPFYEQDGTPNFSDDYLAQVFRRIVREETMKKVFYDGSIRNTTDFIRFCRSREHEMFFVDYKGSEAGFFWLQAFRHKSAFINYCFYREFWGKTSFKISRHTIDFIFDRQGADGDHLVDVLLGLTPATNELAIQFLLKNGMTILGKVPGFLYDAMEETMVDGVFSYLPRHKKSTISFPSFLFIH